MKILEPPLAEHVQQLFGQAQEIYVVSPWLKYGTVKWTLSANSNIDYQNVHILFSANLQDFVTKSSDIEAIEWLLDQGAEVRSITNLHAKIYLADTRQAIVTSANFTASGFGLSSGNGNVEIGVLIDHDPHAMMCLQHTVRSWFSESQLITTAWLEHVRQYLACNMFQEASQKIQETERELRKLNQKFSNTRFQVKKVCSDATVSAHKQKHTLKDVSVLSSAMADVFITKDACAIGIQYFAEGLTYVRSLDNVRHIISTTYRPHEHKITLNVGNWEILTFRRRREELHVTFCVDFSLFHQESSENTLLKTLYLSPRWSGEKAFGFVIFHWDYQTFQKEEHLQQSWRSAMHHAVNTFKHWKASSYMKSHRKDLFKIFVDETYADLILSHAYRK